MSTVDFQPAWSDGVAKVLTSMPEEMPLVNHRCSAGGLQRLQYLVNILNVFFQCLCGDYHIFNVCQAGLPSNLCLFHVKRALERSGRTR